MEETNKAFKPKNFMRSTISSQSKQNHAKKSTIMTSPSLQPTSHQHNKENDDVTMIKEVKRKTSEDEVTMARLKLKKIHDDVIIRKSYVQDDEVIQEQKAEQPPPQQVSPEMEKMKIRILCLEKIIKNLKVKNKKLQIIVKQQRAEQQKEKEQKAQLQQQKQSESRISKLDFHPIRDLLGSGDVTTTYSGRYGDDDVIVKRFKAPMTSSDAIYSKAECEMLRGLRHRNIVGIIAVQCDISDCYLVMETTNGGKSLQEILLEPENTNGMKLENLLPICTSAATGMKYLHENQPQILHLNLKPSNIIIERDGETSRIQDFAFSKLRSRPVTSSSMVYLAPEMTSHPVHISSKNDVFAFAQIIKQMTSGLMKGNPHQQQKLDDVTNELLFSRENSSQLPSNLTFLIELCTDRDFRRRPNFADIVDNLKEIALQRSPFVTSSTLRPVENFLAKSNRGDVRMTSSTASSPNKRAAGADDVTTARGSDIQSEFATNMESIKQMFDRRFNGYIHEVESTCRKLTSSYDVITTKYGVNMTSPKKLK